MMAGDHACPECDNAGIHLVQREGISNRKEREQPMGVDKEGFFGNQEN